MSESDRWIFVPAAVALTALVVFGWICGGAALMLQNTILALTALGLLWYTLETRRLRRDAEARTKREGEPRIDFHVRPIPNPFPPGPEDECHMRFVLYNHAANSGSALVHARLHMGEKQGEFPKGHSFDGKAEWDITPWLRFWGHFDLREMIRNATDNETLLPAELTLAMQVDVYGGDGCHITKVLKNYTVRTDNKHPEIWFWQETSAASLTSVQAPLTLPRRNPAV